MKLFRAADVADLCGQMPDDGQPLAANWIEGPFNADRLDVGVITVNPGGETPPHVHIGGQVIIVTTGRGFVEAGGDRMIIEPGDVVICPPGELHTHGALDDGPMAHLTVTAGGYTFPDA
jgi:quercetin dioxygenase-like cupin family protein